MRQHARGWNNVHDYTARACGASLFAPALRAGYRLKLSRGVRRASATLVVLFTLFTLFASACATLNAHTPERTASREWPSALSEAEAAASTAQFGKADTLLATFARRHPDTPEATETAYWRALFKVDPANSTPSLDEGLALLDGYLASSRPRQHVVEASPLRRIAAQVDAATKATAKAVAAATTANANAAEAKAQAVDAKDAAKDASKATESAPNAEAEIKRLKDELAKATAELDRIKRRLAEPKR